MIKMEDMLGMVTSIHLPMSQKTFAHLPLEQQKAVEDVLEIGKHVDIKLENSGRKPMGEDVWWLYFELHSRLGTPPSVT